jgi:hypothetical protein
MKEFAKSLAGCSYIFQNEIKWNWLAKTVQEYNYTLF